VLRIVPPGPGDAQVVHVSDPFRFTGWFTARPR
jgi:hypothetical protein